MAAGDIQQSALLEMVERMPAFPRSVQKVLSMTSRPDIAPKALVSVIEHDPVLTGKVLKVVNSAYFGLSRQLVSIKHAVVFVGINTIKHLALSIAAIGSLPRRNQAGFDIDGYLRHSLTTGTIARYIARRSNPSVRDIEDYFLAGLIHDIGKVVLALYVPDEYSVVLRTQSKTKVPIQQAEKEALGFCHTDISGMLATRWQLPKPLVKAIERHHTIPDVEQDATHLDFCLYAANLMAEGVRLIAREAAKAPQGPRRRKLVIPKGYPMLPKSVESYLGFTTRAFLDDLPTIKREIAKAQIFMNL